MVIINSIVNILGLLWMFLLTYTKYIGIAVLILCITIWILKTESISRTFKIILIVIISVCVCIMLSNYRDEIIDEKYIERNEMVNNKSLIGLSEEGVIALLGKPANKYTYQLSGKNYIKYNYSAGTIREEWLWGECYSTKYYELDITFNENGIVKSAYIKESPWKI